MTGAPPAVSTGASHAPASYEQEEAHFLSGLAPGSRGLHLSTSHLVFGDLRIPTLRRAWKGLLREHETLRTTLVRQRGRLFQEIANDADVPLPLVDLCGLATDQRRARADRLRSEFLARPFSLARGPLVRAALVRTRPAEHVLLICAHRAVADERSMAILVTDLSERYAAALRGRSPRAGASSPEGRYTDHALRQREQANGPETRRALDWWTTALTPAPEPPDLPGDRPRTPTPVSPSGNVPFVWGAHLATALTGLADAEGTTHDVVVLAAFQALLHRHGGQDRLAVAVPSSTRPRSAFDTVIGPFTRPLVIRSDLARHTTFRELVAGTARAWRDALAHGVPHSHLVRELNARRGPGRVPLCDVAFVRRGVAGAELRLPGTTVREQEVEEPWTHADLTLVLDGPPGPRVSGRLRFRTDMFDRASVRRVVHQLRTLLTAGLDDPDLPVLDLPLDGPSARSDRPDTGFRGVDRSVHAAFLERARLAPEATAMSWDGTNLTYRELARRADRVTAALLESGDVAGLPVAVRMAPGPGQVAALLGVLGAGAHLLCLGTGDTGSRGRESLSELRPVHLLQEGGTEDALTRWYRSELGGRVVDTDVLPTGVEAPERAPRPPAGLAYVAYTSGTTGRPKGIPQTDAALSQFVRWFATRFGVGPGSRVAQWAAPGYDAALVEVFAALASGATLCPVPERTRTHPARLAAWLATERITLFQTVPSFARELTRVVARPGAGGIPELRHLLMAGETLPGELVADLQAALPATRLVNLYGPTESILATFHEISGPVRGHVPIGAPVPGRRILVVDEQDRRCPTGVTGHLVIHSPFVTPGRVGDGGGDAPEFRPLAGHGEALSGEGRYYRTGDLARVRWDGLLEFRGRGDSQIKFFGTRVELTEIETALSADASVSECAAVALPEADGLAGRLIVFVVPAPGSPEEGGPRSWLALLRRRFGASMPPVSFLRSARLPRNVGGKVDRRLLVERVPAHDGPRRPASRVQRVLAEIWSEVLGGVTPDAEDRFFSLGGHSLLVPEVIVRIRDELGVETRADDHMTDPALAELSFLVESLSGETDEPERTTGTPRSTPIQPERVR